MPLNVDLLVTPSPESLPATGGPFTVTFQASTDQGASQLRASYSLDPGVPYALAGPTTLGPVPVAEIPADYEMGLTLEPSGAGAAAFVKVRIAITEVGAGGGAIPRSCNVTLGPAAAAFGLAAPAAAGAGATLGARLKAFRAANGLSQKEVADQIGVSAHQISQVEHGVVPAGDVRQKLEMLMGA